MKKSILISILFFFSLSVFGQETGPRNLLTGRIGPGELSEILITSGDWHPFPTISEPEAWESVPELIRTSFIREGVKYLDYTWPVIPATAALDFVRSGNRTHYENISFERRNALTSLVMAELFERQDRFISQIVNGIWAICEESYWGVSAHLDLQSRGAGLPDITEPTIDLFAAETSCQMAWILYLLGTRLDDESPLIRERIEHEIGRRILTPGLERTDFWWMGYDERSLNNWTPWICSNWLQSVLLIEKVPERRTEAVYKIMTILDHFMNAYPADGGCDEGPGYWGHAGGSLFECLDDLYSVSGGRINLFDEQLIKNIGLYIRRVYISYPYFINFADASAIPGPDPFLVYRYGKRIGDEDLMDFGAFLAVEEWTGPESLNYLRGGLGRRQLPDMFALNEVLGRETRNALPLMTWLPDIQVMAVRASDRDPQGLYLAAKGGHNAESHNHNDVGNFIIYLNGSPAIIDAGVETYRRQTFSDERYTIWTMQSAYHNLPTINGQMQMNGRQYEARNVSFEKNNNGARFGLNLEKTYTEAAGLKTFRRSIDFRTGKEILLKDQFQFNQANNQLVLNILTHFAVKENKPGLLTLVNRNKPEDLLFIAYDTKKLTVQPETIPIDDARLQSVWGDELIRLIFTAPKVPGEFEYTLRFRDSK